MPLLVLPKTVFANKLFLSCSLEIMEQMALLQETSYERLYRWTQSRTKNVFMFMITIMMIPIIPSWGLNLTQTLSKIY